MFNMIQHVVAPWWLPGPRASPQIPTKTRTCRIDPPRGDRNKHHDIETHPEISVLHMLHTNRRMNNTPICEVLGPHRVGHESKPPFSVHGGPAAEPALGARPNDVFYRAMETIGNGSRHHQGGLLFVAQCECSRCVVQRDPCLTIATAGANN